MNTDEHCRNCAHWTPGWTGEAWGVRSFADAPEAERARILARLKSEKEKDDTNDNYDSLCAIPAADLPSGGPNAIQIGDLPDNWPEWGECALAEFEGEDNQSSLCRAIDGSQYMAKLRCHADFGCVQWAPYKS